MFSPPKHRRILVAAALVTIAFAMVPMRSAISWYERPFGGILVDPDGFVSNFGLPTWDGFKQGLSYPDQIVEVDGRPLIPEGRFGYRAAVWDRAVAEAHAAGRASVHVRARTERGERAMDLAIAPLDPSAFWLNGAAPIAIAILYVCGALIALGASPKGRLARTFAKTTLFAALFLFTLFDYHTTRQLVPLFHLAFAMVPVGFFVLPLRLPDDVPLLDRRPWIPSALEALGAALGAGMILVQLSGGTTVALRSVCTVLFGASFFFFAATFLFRFARAKGDRRATMRALLVAMVPAHVVLGGGAVLSSLKLWGATSALLAVPALALTPLSSVVALIRHDLWGSRALLSRVLMRGVIVAVTCAAATALGTAVGVLLHAPLGSALLGAAAAGVVAGIVVKPALRVGDRALFPARAEYKPTIEQLSEELTLINVPEDVGLAVERTVRRWLPCEKVEFVLAGPHPDLTSEDAEAVSGIRVRSSSAGLPRGSDSGAFVEPADHLTIDVLFRDSPLAALRVGKKRGGALFTSEDVDLLRTIANQAALALAHAYSYQELELRRKQQAAAWRGEREALVETVAAEIAHEVRYPINYFRSIFQRGAGEVRLDGEEVDIGCDEVERLERLVAGLRRVATHRLERQPVRVDELVQKVERLLRDQLGARRLEVELSGAPALRCDPDQVTQVLVNLVSNAIDAAGEGGRVGVTFRSGAEGGVLTVWDTGPGFTGDPGRVFAPWYTTKPRGTGLGLSITHRIVRAHHWKIEPERDAERTRFVIEVPPTDLVHALEDAEVA
jgi:signal transduction histidine kinase